MNIFLWLLSLLYVSSLKRPSYSENTDKLFSETALLWFAPERQSGSRLCALLFQENPVIMWFWINVPDRAACFVWIRCCSCKPLSRQLSFQWRPAAAAAVALLLNAGAPMKYCTLQSDCDEKWCCSVPGRRFERRWDSHWAAWWDVLSETVSRSQPRTPVPFADTTSLSLIILQFTAWDFISYYATFDRTTSITILVVLEKKKTKMKTKTCPPLSGVFSWTFLLVYTAHIL